MFGPIQVTSNLRRVIKFNYYKTISQGSPILFHGMQFTNIEVLSNNVKFTLSMEHRASFKDFIDTLFHSIKDTGIIVTPKGNTEHALRMFLWLLKRKYPCIPNFYVTDDDPAGMIDYMVASYGAQEQPKMNTVMAIPSTIYLSSGGSIYENGELNSAHCSVLSDGDFTRIRNAIETYRQKDHIDSIYLRNKLQMMRDWGHKQSLVAVNPHKLYDQIMRILELAEQKRVNLNSVLSDGDAYVRKIKLIDFDIDAIQFVWHFLPDEEFQELPNQLFNKLAMRLNEFDLDILPMRLLPTMEIPAKICNSYTPLKGTTSS